MTRKGDPDRIDEPDVMIGARVKAKKIRSRSKPRTEVEFHGEAETPEGRSDLETASGSERQNLPREVEPGVTYRDVRVEWRTAARLHDPAADERSEDSGPEGPEEGSRS